MLWEGDKLMYGGVSYDAAYLGSTLLWRSFITDYFTIEVVSGGTINFNFSMENAEMSINGGQFTRIGVSAYTVTAGDVIRLRGTEPFYAGSTAHIRGDGTVKYIVYGNTMSLIHGDDFPDKNTYLSCPNFFKNCTSIIDASGLILPSASTSYGSGSYILMFDGCTSLLKAPELPATSLSEQCYAGMFHGCTSLLEAPELPATTLSERCYGEMFAGCSSLIKAPELPATTLADKCYESMFYNCTSLTTSPILPAETLNTLCYSQMFYNCTSLNNVTCLATDISANYCTKYWLYGVSQTGTFTKAASMNDWATGDDGIPSGWTVIDA